MKAATDKDAGYRQNEFDVEAGADKSMLTFKLASTLYARPLDSFAQQNGREPERATES